jgi:NADH:ubiquinone oxidoreductase subunit D
VSRRFAAQIAPVVGGLHRNEIALPLLVDTGTRRPLPRAASVPWDLRTAMPYSSDEDFDFKIALGSHGDNHDRYAFLRMQEMKESVKTIEQALKAPALPESVGQPLSWHTAKESYA